MDANGSSLRGATAVALVDWPSRDVPESLARAGLAVSVHGGPAPDDWSVFEVGPGGADAPVVERRTGVEPERADVVYSHRPLAELEGIVALAQRTGAGLVWLQSGESSAGVRDARGCWLSEEDRAAAQRVVEAAGLRLVDDVYIGDAARALGSS